MPVPSRRRDEIREFVYELKLRDLHDTARAWLCGLSLSRDFARFRQSRFIRRFLLSSVFRQFILRELLPSAAGWRTGQPAPTGVKLPISRLWCTSENLQSVLGYTQARGPRFPLTSPRKGLRRIADQSWRALEGA